MKQGKTLAELAAELVRQSEAKKDYVVNTEALAFEAPHALRVGEIGVFEPTRIARDQIADRIGVPRAFANRIAADYPDLYAETFNTLFSGEPRRRFHAMGTSERRYATRASGRFLRPFDRT